MVLIDGVKYACERCIRGHRVTTCTHTDQPLTKIKPKGRPASQCQHCRDQRKLKSLHISCACKKSGHSINCYKSSTGCTCYQNHKLKALDKSKKKDSKLPSKEAGVDIDLKNIATQNVSPPSDLKQNSQSTSEIDYKLPEDSLDFNYNLFDQLKYDDLSNDLPNDGLDFPLFPLIGSNSFETENMPLSSIPDSVESSVPPESYPAGLSTDANDTSSNYAGSANGSNGGSANGSLYAVNGSSHAPSINPNVDNNNISLPNIMDNTGEASFENQSSDQFPNVVSSKAHNNNNIDLISNNSNIAGNNLNNHNTTIDSYLEQYFSDPIAQNSTIMSTTASFSRSQSFKNRPPSVLSMNSTVSNDSRFEPRAEPKIDPKFESAFPPSTLSSNSNSNLNLNLGGHLPNPNHYSVGGKKYPFNNILESNETYLLDDDLQIFMGDGKELVYK